MNQAKIGTYKYIDEKHFICSEDIVDITDIVLKNRDKNNINKLITGDTIKIENDVITVIKPSNDLICGILRISSNISYGQTSSGAIKKIFTPYDNSYPEFIVSTKKAFQPTDIYVVIKFDKWSELRPMGTIVRYIGDIGIIESEREYIREIATRKWINNKNLKIHEYIEQDLTPDRIDLTNKQIVSIDPKGCIDIDDALHILKTDNGYELGIHIADVSSYIPINSVLDKEIACRCKSIYLERCQINMIPEELSINKCSLLANKQKLRAYSLLVLLDNNYKIISYKFQKSFIIMHKNMDYDFTQKLIDLNKDVQLCMLYETAKNLDIGKSLNGNSIINGNSINEGSYDTHKMVEIYMVLANHLAGKTIFDKFKEKSLLRKHNGMKNIKSEHKQSMQIPKQIYDYVKFYQYYRAEYCFGKEDALHIGLGNIMYTHFTSPIRRYADIIVHRMLYDSNQINANMISLMNETHKQYHKYEIESRNLEKIFSLPKIYDTYAYIIDIENNRIRVNITEIDMTLSFALYPDKLKHLVKQESTESGITLESDNKKIVLNLFDKIDIKLIVAVKDRKKLLCQILNPPIQSLFNCNYQTDIE